MSYLLYIGLSLLAYILYEKVFKIYYIYYYYKRQGVASMGFPLPFVGNSPRIIKNLKQQEDGKGSLFTTVYQIFGEKIPPLILNFQGSHHLLMVSDPEIVEEIYVKYNKYFDKSGKTKN